MTVAFALLASSAPVTAAPKPITGKLNRSGYTVIALAADGQAKSVRVALGTFRLRPPTTPVTLHLRGPDGTYAGPIVIRGEGKRAILGVKQGAKLGLVKIGPTYSRPSKKLPEKWVDTTRKAQAKRGVPIGAGVFGRVLSRKPPRTSVPGDSDVDGIPDVLDIDDNGDLILDNFQRPNAARAAQVLPGSPISLTSTLQLALEDSVNANAGGLTLQDLDARLATYGVLQVGYPIDRQTELDCTGLRYCSPGGSGIMAFAGPPAPTPANGPPFPACCDPDGDGFGTLTTAANLLPGTFFLAHRSTTSQIGTGDVLIARITSGGVETQFPTALQTVFATGPALVSYSDGAGNSATVSYPLPAPFTGSPPGPDRVREGFPVSAGPGGDVVLTLTFWRPQRQAITGEPGQWTDIGGLLYGAVPQNFGRPGPRDCPASAYSTTDPELALEGVAGPGAGVRDRAIDRPASPANTLTLSVNLTQCLAAQGLSWNPGQSIELALNGRSTPQNLAQDLAQQRLYFKRQ